MRRNIEITSSAHRLRAERLTYGLNIDLHSTGALEMYDYAI